MGAMRLKVFRKRATSSSTQGRKCLALMVYSYCLLLVYSSGLLSGSRAEAEEIVRRHNLQALQSRWDDGVDGH